VCWALLSVCRALCSVCRFFFPKYLEAFDSWSFVCMAFLSVCVCKGFFAVYVGFLQCM